MGATTDQNLIAEKTTLPTFHITDNSGCPHNFFSDLVMLIPLSGKKRFSDIMAIFVPKSLPSLLI